MHHSRALRPTDPSPEDLVMSDWLADEGDYLDLERPRGTVELEIAIGFDVDEAERA